MPRRRAGRGAPGRANKEVGAPAPSGAESERAVAGQAREGGA